MAGSRRDKTLHHEVAQFACNLWGPKAMDAFRVLRRVLSQLRALTLPALEVFGRTGGTSPQAGSPQNNPLIGSPLGTMAVGRPDWSWNWVSSGTSMAW